MANQSSGKDFWDIVDSVSKILSGVVLVIIAFFINQGAQRIVRSNEETRIMQSLIEDLTKKDESTRNDVALLVLERHLTDQHRNKNEAFDTAYFTTITETILRQQIFSDSIFSQETSVCYILLSKYNKKLADSILTFFQTARRNEERTQFVTTTTLKARRPVAASRNKKEAQIIGSLNKKICYIQYRNAANDQNMEKLRRKFVDTNWITPPLEQVPGEYASTVRYFHPEDEKTARRAIAIAQSVLGAQFRFEIVAVLHTDLDIPKGQVEVWIDN